MARPMSARRPIWVTLPAHEDLPPAERPTFLVKPMSFGELQEWLAAPAAAKTIPAILDERLRDWRGVTTEDGRAIQFSATLPAPDGTSGWRDELSREECDALVTLIVNGSARVAPADRGFSSTPSG